MITKEEFIRALDVVAQYTAEEIRRENKNKDIVFIDYQRVKNAEAIVENIISTFELTRNCRYEHILFKRYAVMWWLRKNTGKSLKEIALIFGKSNHATVINACKQHEALTAINLGRYMSETTEILSHLSAFDRKWK